MLVARLAGCALKSPLNGALKIQITQSLKGSNLTFVRSFREGGRGFTRRTQARVVEIQKADKLGLKKKFGPLEVGQIAVAGGAALGLGALCYYGLGLSNEPGAIDRMYVWPDYVKARIRDTYMYFGASMTMTAASAVAIFRSPMGHRFFHLCAKHPIMSTVGVIAALIASGQAMMAIPYSPGLGTKQMMWLVNCGMIGLAVAPVGIFGGALAVRAAWYTAGIIGGLSSVAMCAPSEKFLTWGAPLGLGLGGVVIASLGSAFLPPTSAIGLSLYSISLYGGLILFSAFLLYDTQKIVHKAESHPNMYGVRPYDPINASHHIVMDTVNIFVRIVQILALGGAGRRK
ncbi:UNVERIFIED_CONTAM: hypothetical protein GTU68_066687 [Idotea baltica]|nr:hypothetical protein [Idotea baltica]MCL4118769.1 hypothetical protein [Idotea baltica]